MNARLYAIVSPVLAGLRTYHRHEVRGLEHVPRFGPAMIVINHSLATYDALLLGHAVHERTGRFTRGLADRLMFRVPLVRTLARELGIMEGSQDNGAALLEAGELVMLAPGGMREALRPSSEEFEIDWHGRQGFARLGRRAGSPVVSFDLIRSACHHDGDPERPARGRSPRRGVNWKAGGGAW